ncbi:MAG: hypothetical protein GY797_22530, partial [Deltaproteobacteria bacterium]|nr:hypothetical protein [Deltaproteobacteria bacterium]
DYDGIIFEPGTIPVADDIGYNRELVQRFFKDNGDITFLEAENGEEANKKAGEHHPDLILPGPGMGVPEFGSIMLILTLKRAISGLKTLTL